MSSERIPPLPFGEFLAQRSLTIRDKDRWEVVQQVIQAASESSVEFCYLGRGRGATTLAIACAAWLETTRQARFPVLVSASQRQADTCRELLAQILGRQPLTWCGEVLHRQVRTVVRHTEARNGDPHSWLRPDFVIIDSPFPQSLDYRSHDYEQRRRALAAWLGVCEPESVTRAILVNC